MTDVVVQPDETASRLRSYVRDHPDVRKARFQDHTDPIQGACYVLAEAYFHAKGGMESGLDVYRLDWGDVDEGADSSHWFLRDGSTVIDLSLPTPSDGANIPWDVAQRRAFITGYTPSNRAQRLLAALDVAV